MEFSMYDKLDILVEEEIRQDLKIINFKFITKDELYTKNELFRGETAFFCRTDTGILYFQYFDMFDTIMIYEKLDDKLVQYVKTHEIRGMIGSSLTLLHKIYNIQNGDNELHEEKNEYVYTGDYHSLALLAYLYKKPL